MQTQARAGFAALLDQGWTDALRAVRPGGQRTFRGYTRDRGVSDKGMRRDHRLLSPGLAGRLADAGVDRWVRGEPDASDRAPAWVELDL